MVAIVNGLGAIVTLPVQNYPQHGRVRSPTVHKEGINVNRGVNLFQKRAWMLTCLDVHGPGAGKVT